MIPMLQGGEDRTPVKNKVTAHRSSTGPLHNSSFASLLSCEMMIKVRLHAQRRKQHNANNINTDTSFEENMLGLLVLLSSQATMDN